MHTSKSLPTQGGLFGVAGARAKGAAQDSGLPGPAMRRFWRRQFIQLVESTLETFGVSKLFWKMLLGRPLMLFLDRLFLALDTHLYPDCVAQPVREPVFIIGHPRSGTTFLHRFIHTTGEFACFQFWEIVFPSLTFRKLLRPWIEKRNISGRDIIIPQETGHEQRLASIEEEELLWYKYLSTQLNYIYTPLGFCQHSWDNVVFGDAQPRGFVDESMAYLRACFQRQIYWTKRQRIVAKMNYSGMRLKNLLKAFPDARVVFLERSPYETIPSHLSLWMKLLDYLWGLDKLPSDAVKRYIHNRYQYDVAYYCYIDRLEKEGFFESHGILKVKYDDMKIDFRTTILKIFDFAQLPLSEAMRKRIEEQHDRQRVYQRAHRNLSLEDLGFSLQRLREDLACGGFVQRSEEGR